MPIEGTPLGKSTPVDGLEFVRMIAVARLVCPKSVVRLSAGRARCLHTRNRAGPHRLDGCRRADAVSDLDRRAWRSGAPVVDLRHADLEG